MDRGVQVGHADRPADDLHRQVVGLADRLAGLQAAAGQRAPKSTCRDGRGRRRRRTAAGRPNSRGDDDQRLVEQLLRFQVEDQRRQGLVELLDQRVLLQDAVVVDVPAGAVEEVEVVRDLDEPHARLDQPAGRAGTAGRTRRRRRRGGCPAPGRARRSA